MDCMRLAVAAIALRHKPPSQSVASCVQDLQSAFQPAGPCSCACERSWRAHVLHLESESALLKAQLEAERAKCQTLVAPENNPCLDKKQKKKVKLLAATIVSRVSPMVAVDHLLKSIGRADEDQDLLAAAFCAAIEAISLELGTVTTSSSTFSSKTIDGYALVLQDIVSTTLPRQEARLDRCLGVLSKRILQPCIQCFVPLSLGLLEDLRQGRVSDLRYHMLSLVRTVLAALFSLELSLSLESLRMALVLDTLTELRQTVFPVADRFWEGYTRVWGKLDIFPRATRGSSAASPKALAAAYEKRLARKDGLWFLCCVLHLLSSSFGGAWTSREMGSTCERMLREAVVDEVLRLLGCCNKACWVDNGQQTQSDSLSVSQPTRLGTSEAIRGADGREYCRVDEAEYAMILGATERVLLDYAA